jgi:folate-binding protein YgfZ
MTGYDALRTSAARVHLQRGLIAATGEDRARFLHAMSTNQVQDLKPGECRHAFFLNSQGRILADAWIVCREGSLLLDTEPETKDKLLAHLEKYIIADDVVLEDLSAALSVIAVEGPEATAWPGAFPISAMGGNGWRAYTHDPEGLWESLERFPLATAADLALVRLEKGFPRYGEDILETHLVQETGQMGSVSFTKGCYLGQEIVERVRSRGAVHRHLRPLRVAGQAAPAPLSDLHVGDLKVGTLTSAAYS